MTIADIQSVVGIKPYHIREKTLLYNCDCRKVIAKLRHGDVDIIIADPPYGMKYESNHYIGDNPFGKIQGDDKFPMDVIKQCIELAGSATLSFCRWNTFEELIPKPKSFLVWDKGGHGGGDLDHEYARRWEAIAFWTGYLHQWREGRPEDVIYTQRVSGDKLLHPTEKPVGLIKVLIQHHAGRIVFDPYAGSCTTLVAADQLGLVGIGCEVDERYCKVGVERLKQMTLQF